MLEVTLINAHILYQKAGHPDVTPSKFKETLVQQLIGGNSVCLWGSMESAQGLKCCRTSASTTCFFTSLWLLKLLGNAKSTYKGLTLTVSVAPVMPVIACIQHHFLRDITLYVSTIFQDANGRLGWPTAKEIQMKTSSTLFIISSEMTFIFDAFQCVSFVHVYIVVVELVQLLILYSSYRIFQNDIKLAKHVLKCFSVLKFLN